MNNSLKVSTFVISNLLPAQQTPAVQEDTNTGQAKQASNAANEEADLTTRPHSQLRIVRHKRVGGGQVGGRIGGAILADSESALKSVKINFYLLSL